jgi:peptidoglycan/xylan/chitin deacetylase (PgdA/CDA1 family)
MLGHQLSVHTWSHPSLTTLTTEQVIAELGWTAKIIKAVTGSVLIKFLIYRIRRTDTSASLV